MRMEQMQAELARLATLPSGAQMSLAPEFYITPDWLALERRTIFRKEWICVGRADELPAVGDYRVSDIDGAPVIISRRADGQLGAMSGVCLHRMALLAEGDGNAKGFSCPYHGWTYDLNGKLIAAPRMPRDFDRSTRTLPPIRLEEWNGFIYVNLDESAAPLATRLKTLTTDLAPYHIERMRTLKHEQHTWRTNWKVLVENFLEPYHLNVTHTATLARFAAPSGVEILPRTHGYQFHRHRMLDTSPPVPLDPLIGIPNSDLTAEQRQTAYVGGIFPTHLFSVTWDAVFWLSLQPHGVDEVLVDFGLAGPFNLPEGQPKDPNHPNLYYLGLADAVNAEDRLRVESIQRGARSGLGRQSILHPHEDPIGSFIAYLHSRLSSGADESS